MRKRDLLFLIIFTFLVKANPQNITFGHLSLEDGLSNNSVNCLLQDHYGFLWFGTDDGLNRFDGYQIRIFRNDPGDTHSLSDNSIYSVFEDRAGFLWIGTNNGDLNRYDQKADKFEHWNIESQKVFKGSSQKENRITCIYEDKHGLFWIGTYKNGLYRFNPSENNFSHWRHKADEPGSLSYNYITAILEDNKGSLWIGTYNGLNRFNPESSDKPFNCFYSDPKNAHSLSNNLIWSFTQSNFELNTFWICTVDGLTSYNSKTEKFSRINLPESNLQFGNSVSSIVEQLIGIEKILWCGTYAGLIQINSSTSQTKRFVKEEYNQSGISSNYINRIIKDDSGVLWLATADNGLNYLSLKSMKFNAPLHLTGEKSYNKKLEVFFNKNINAINSTVDGTLWLGCDNGLYCIRDFVKGEIDKYYPHTEGLNIWSLAPGFSNDLWIGTYGQGLWQLDTKTGKLKSWNIEDPGSSFKNFSFNFVKSILQDNKGMLWIGFWGPGLTRLNPKNGNYQNWQNKENDNFSLSYNDVWVVYQDSRNRIWIGTNGGGLNLFDDREGGKFYCWSKGEREFGSLSDNRIYSIYESANRQPGSKKDETVLWIGTGAGLNKFIIKKDVLVNSGNNQKPGLSDLKAEIRCYTSKDGLPDNAVNSILEDDQGDLWIGTNAGISFFNVVKN
ncbi:MAG TPA: two-component regulator propeller domain-containing protein, partial [Ignavibacteriaceae bacterium]|nr:two-component regulator propeller domain-containing protein [Ignavibacteriaceae bacterium]